jgi:hypothetical protein
LLSLVVLGLFSPPAGAQSEPPDPDPYAVVRGMTVSCPDDGRVWGSRAMVATLERLADLGANWIAIHPYGGIRGDGTVGRSRIDRLYRDPSWLTRAIDEAHRQNLKILVKPHLAYWGSPFAWRGEITFGDDEMKWRRFFTTYEEWITRVATLSERADAFAVGTELDRTVQREDEWRAIIASVRARTDVPLTYSAGWDTFERVPFWDALDVIGIQAYFPLVDHEGVPTEHEIRTGWAAVRDRLEEFGRDWNRRVVLGELGYNRSLSAAVRPWEHRQHADPEAEALQILCLSVALETIRESEAIVGSFLWKWFPGELPVGNFLLSSPAVRRAIGRQWAAVDHPDIGATPVEIEPVRP